MSGRPHIKITESVENLREILKQQKKSYLVTKFKCFIYFTQNK